MSSKKNDVKQLNTYIIPIILLCVIIVGILSSFGLKMVNQAKAEVENDYRQETQEIGHLYEKNLFAVETAATVIANQLFEREDLFTNENIKSIKLAANTLDIDNIYIVDSDYKAVDIKGQSYDDVRSDERFEVIFNSKVTMNKFIADEDGRDTLYVMRPIASRMINKGYVVFKYSPNVMDTLLNNPKYSSRKTFGLVSSDGSVIESTGSKSYILEEGGNVIDRAQELYYIDGSYNSFRQAIVDCRSGSQQTVLQEENKYIYYSPVEGCKAIVVMLVDTKDVERSFSSVSKNIRNMTIGIGISIVAFILLIVGVSLFNRAKYNIETEDLQNKADTDLLTDLYNKAATERMIREYLDGEGKNSMSMLFVLDIDDFKKINDTRGHAFGDSVLQSFGHSIKAWFRVGDILGRIGGDEFMIFIKDVKDPEVIRREGSRIQQFFEGFNVGEYTKYSPTASVGGAVYPTDGDDFESLYKAADKAVYKSKKDGKNRVSYYSDLNVKEKDVVIDKKEEK